jgi:hypothetical protein
MTARRGPPYPSADLDSVATFSRRLRSLSWFAAVGQPLTASERREALDHAAALCLGDLLIQDAADWRAAERVTRDPAWDPRWWQAEDAERLALLAELKTKSDPHALMGALTRVTDDASSMVFGAASVAASRDGIADQALARVAAGAATQAAYQAALALAARRDDAHMFAIKFRLFAAGRWPLGIVGGAFFLF